MSALTALLRGGGAHVDPLRAVAGLDWTLAGRTPAGHAHSIWQLVFHVNFWIEAELRCIENAAEEHPLDPESWPPSASPPDEAAWLAEVARLERSLAQLIALAAARASTLARIAHRSTGATVEDLLWGLVAHNAYHIGQVVQARHALGAWPPAGP